MIGVITDAAEQPAMLELQKTYGKTIHTWAIDEHPDLPIGPPSLMMSYTPDHPLDPEVVRKRDEKYGMDSDAKRELRKGYLPPYQTVKGADQWEQSGRSVQFTEKETEVKM